MSVGLSAHVTYSLSFLQNFIHNISVAHRLQPPRRVGEECVGARVVEAVEGFLLADVQLLCEHQDYAALLAPADGISHRASGVRASQF